MAQASLDGLDDRLEVAIVRSTPGSWVRDAFRDEYQFTVANGSPVAVIVQDVALADMFRFVEARPTRDFELEAARAFFR